jgi:hypothetical protein
MLRETVKNEGVDVMKKVAVLALICISVLSWAMADGYKPKVYDVGTNSIIILPGSGMPDYRTTNTVYAQGAAVIGPYTNNYSWTYFALTNGVSGTTTPNWKPDTRIVDGTITWEPYPTVRRVVSTLNITTNTIHLGFEGAEAEYGKGIYLKQDGSFTSDDYQGAIQAESHGTGAKITVQVLD